MRPEVFVGTPNPSRAIAVGVVLAGMLAYWLLFAFEARYGFNLADEGFYWYGVQRTLLGEIATVDFHGYNPARYYWAAALLKATGTDGLVAVRAATAAFTALGTGAGAWLVWRGYCGNPFARIAVTALTAALFLLWTLPWWKGYDIAISVFLVAGLAAVLSKPVAGRFLGHGLLVGFAALLGRNHGVYAVAACMLAVPVLMFANRVDWIRCGTAWAAGVLLAFSPMLLAILLDRDFGAMFWKSMRYMFLEYRGTNLPLPVPWPWRLETPFGWNPAAARPWIVSGMFLALPVFCVVGAAAAAIGAWRKKAIESPIFVASVATAAPYLFVAFSRADVSHLAQALFPFLIGILVFPWPAPFRTPARAAVAIALSAAALLIALPLHPGYLGRTQPNWTTVDIAGDALQVPKPTGDTIRRIQHLAATRLPPGGTVYAAPNLPGVYALLRVKSPVWEIYPLLPRSAAFEGEEIERIKRANPPLVLINDMAIDRNELRRFAATHPLTQHYIERSFLPLPLSNSRSALKIYVARDIDRSAVPND